MSKRLERRKSWSADWMCGGSGSTTAMTDNNGNLKKQDVYIPGSDTFTQFYGYDALNRLQKVNESKNGAPINWQQQYVYDRYGNRTIDQVNTWGTGIPKPNFGVDTNTNRLTAPAGSTMTYDVAGNLTFDNSDGIGGTRTYDAENRMKQAWANNQWQTYSYDGDGRRVKRIVNGTETWQVYGLGGELVAEYAANVAASSPKKEYGYRNGQLLVTADAPPPAPNGYTYQRTLTIDHTKVPNTDQSNFPVLISGTYSYLATVANGGNVQNSNGYDVIFTSDSGCATKLNHEVETYNPAAGAVNYWVKVPTVSHTSDTTIYMCYSNSSITADQSNKAAVWDANHKGVWHLGNGTTLSVADSTNHLNGTNHSAAAVSGKVDGGAGFDGSSQYISMPSMSLTSLITIEFWMSRTGTLDVRATPISFGRDGVDGFDAEATSTTHKFTKSGVVRVDSGIAVSGVGVWDHIVWTVDSDLKPRLYVNGSLVFTSTDTQAINATTHGAYLGATEDTAGAIFRYALVRLDEVRLSNTVRSANWIATEYNNQNSPSTFYTISSASGGVATAQLHWLVTDQLGTPRMIFDQSGSLANVSRHDYLPFGEEISAGVGGRTTAQGYTLSDNVRQKFTQKERDNETGLDYFGARYYASTQGRFSSPDPSNVGASEFDPQSWNGYAYVSNTPLISTDPDGLWKQVDCSSGKGQCWESDNKNDTISSLAKILNVSARDLNRFFQNPTVHIGDAFDASGFSSYANRASGYVDPNHGYELCRANGAQIQQRMAYDAMLEGLRRGPYTDTIILFGPITRLSGLLAPAAAANDVKLLGTARMNLLNAAEDSKLRNFIKYLYREGAEVGNGSTADAIRYERTTGQLLSAAGHAQKGQEAITGLNRLMLSGKLSCKDAAIAQDIINDLKSALK